MYPVGPEENWSITPEGHIDVPDYKVYGHHEYCMDIFYNSSLYKETLYPFVCFDTAESVEPCRLRYDYRRSLSLLIFSHSSTTSQFVLQSWGWVDSTIVSVYLFLFSSNPVYIYVCVRYTKYNSTQEELIYQRGEN